MTEKTEYITASINLLEQEDELNSTHLAVLCNLKKFMHQSDHQPTFEVGEYYASKTGIVFKITSKTTKEEIAAVKSLVDGEIIDGMIDTTEIMFRYSKPATAEQIAEFKRAEIKNDIDFIIKDGDGDWIEIVENIEDYFQTAEELREVEKNG